jgi:hypothetical protein
VLCCPGQVCLHGLIRNIVGNPLKTLAVSFDSHHIRLTKHSKAADVTQADGKTTPPAVVATEEVMRIRNVCFTYTNCITFAKPVLHISFSEDGLVLIVVVEGNLIHVFDIGETPLADPHAVSLRQTFILSCVDRADYKERIGGIRILRNNESCAVLICGDENASMLGEYATQNQVILIINIRTGLVEHVVTSSFMERSAYIPNRFDVFYDSDGIQKILFSHENGLCVADPTDPNSRTKSRLVKHPLAHVMNKYKYWMLPKTKITILNPDVRMHVFACSMQDKTVRLLMLDFRPNACKQTDVFQLDSLPISPRHLQQPRIFAVPAAERVDIRCNQFLSRSGFFSRDLKILTSPRGLKFIEPWTPLRHKFIKTAATDRVIFRLVCIKEWMEKHHHSSIPRLPTEIWLLIFNAVFQSYCSSRTYKKKLM